MSSLPCTNLNLNLYRVFYVVAKTKSFSESSKVLHISQPAISKHVQNLEYELNTILFNRNNRGIELTPEAKTLLRYVEKAYNFLMLGEKQLQETKELTQGKVSIGITSSLGVYYLKDKIELFMKEHPNIIIKMASNNNKALLNLLTQHTLDLLIIAGEEAPKDLKCIKLTNDEYCFAYNPSSLNIDVKTLEDLTNYPLLLPVKTSNARKKIEEVFYKKTINANPIMELETTEMMLSYTMDGCGIGYLPRKVALNQPNLKIIELGDGLPSEDINIIYDEISLTSSTKEFINVITENKSQL